MKCCRMFLPPSGKPHMGNPLYLIVLSIYVGASGSRPRDIESITLCHMKFQWQIIWYSTQSHLVTIGSCPYRKCYNNPHHGAYRLNFQHYQYSTFMQHNSWTSVECFYWLLESLKWEFLPKASLIGMYQIGFKSPLNTYCSLRLEFIR